MTQPDVMLALRREVSAQFFETITGLPLDGFALQCHAASLALVRTDLLAPARVLRGTCSQVPGQHSWVGLVDKTGVYDSRALVLDPTLWSYTGEEPYVWVGRADQLPHRPHGHGSIWEYGRPERAGESDEEPIVLEEPDAGWSPLAREWLKMFGPLGRRGWMVLFSAAPCSPWPAGEIMAAADADPRLTALIPIDRLGMLTDADPGGLYLGGRRDRG